MCRVIAKGSVVPKEISITKNTLSTLNLNEKKDTLRIYQNQPILVSRVQKYEPFI